MLKALLNPNREPHRSKSQKNPEKNIGANDSHSVRAKPALNLFGKKKTFWHTDARIFLFDAGVCNELRFI